MNRFFRRLPLQAKLMLIGMIPFLFLLYLTVQVYNDKTEKLKLFKSYKTYLTESSDINGLIDAMQEERKFSFDYAMTKKMRQQVVLQRPKTDVFIRRLTKSTDPAIMGFLNYTNLGQLENVRKGVDAFTINPEGVMQFYTNTVFRLNTLNTIPPANTAYLKPVYKDLMVHKILSEMITYLGIIRSNIYNLLITRVYMKETLYGTMGAHEIYKQYDLELKAKATPKMLEQYTTVKNNTALKPTLDYIDERFRTFEFDESFTAPEWWKVSDEGTNSLRSFQNTIWNGLNQKINELYDQEHRAQEWTLYFLIFALICVFAVVSYIVYIINRSLKELRRATEKISNGATDIHVRIDSNDVIGYLGQSILKIDRNNQALANAAMSIGRGEFDVEVQPRSESDILGNAIAQMKLELQHYSQKMEQLVAQRTEELARSNEDLQQFAHVASHDLKEPLRKIATFSNMLSHDQSDVLSDKGKLYLNKIELASHRMSNMIEGVLAYSTVSVNEPPFEIVDLNKIMEGVENDLELAIVQKDAHINYSMLPEMRGMPLLLHQLFYNLVSNALKFSKENVPPVVDIFSEIVERESLTDKNSKAKYLHIVVRDNGIGFNPAYTDRMFGVFFRLNTKDKYEGTGLGLALCRKIVHRHKGEIYAKGVEGEGATFDILFPVK